jgi:hypothetical protein
MSDNVWVKERNTLEEKQLFEDSYRTNSPNTGRLT